MKITQKRERKMSMCRLKKRKRNYKLLLLMVLLLTQVQVVFSTMPFVDSNDNVITGIVTDDNNEPLIGVSILSKDNSNQGTITDFDGRFSLSVSRLPVVLVFSYVGFQTQEVQFSNLKMQKIILKSDAKLLDEVVVVAYGAQKKVSVTGSVSSINNKDLMKTSSANFATTLVGRLPGLTAMQTSGEPGRENVNLFLRGAATTNGTSPLILVDGVPTDNITNIDPHEIANVSILKDASATAVFGVRGANGVILITTQRGEKGKVKVNSSVEYSIQQFAFKPKRIDSWDYAVLRNESKQNEGAIPYSEFSEEDIRLFETWKTGQPEDPYWHPNQNWHKILFKDTAPMIKTNVNISGGTDKVKYFVSAGYVHQGGIFNVESKKKLGYNPQSNLDRYNFRSNIDYKFNSRIKATVNLSSYVEKVNSTNGSLHTIFGGSLMHRPTSAGPISDTAYKLKLGADMVQSQAGRVVADPLDPLESAYALLNRTGYKTETKSGINALTALDIDLGFITPGLTTKGQIAFNSMARSSTYGKRDYVRYKYAELNKEHYYVLDLGVDDDSETPVALSKGAASTYFINLQWHLNYARVFNKKHHVGALLLAQRDYREASEDEAIADKYLPFNVIGFSARGTYAYEDRYLFEVNMGYNGSEQFSPKKRFGFFPAFSAGWVVSNESFLRDNDILSNLKLRYSFGKVGNDKIGNSRFLYLDKINANGGYNDDYYSWHMPSLGHGGKIEEQALGNPDITWEIAKKQNFGIDFGFFHDFSVSFDYFTEDRDNILISRGIVPSIQGRPQSALPKVNLGKVENKGYEVEAAYNKLFKNELALNVRLNYSYNSNKVKYYDEALLSDEYAHRYRVTGYALGQNWGYKIDYSKNETTGRDGSGFFISQESIKNSGLHYLVGTPLPGDFIYVNTSGDDEGTINDRDLVPIKYSSLVPKISYGASLGLSYKGIDFSCLIQGIGKFSKYYSEAGIFEELAGKTYFDMHQDRWSADRYQRKMAGENIKISHPRLANTPSTSHMANTYYIMDASYVRLKNMEIGYTLPSSVTNRIGVNNIRLYVNGNNLYTWHHLETDSFDPEQTGPTQYPNMRTYNFGLNVTF